MPAFTIDGPARPTSNSAEALARTTATFDVVLSTFLRSTTSRVMLTASLVGMSVGAPSGAIAQQTDPPEAFVRSTAICLNGDGTYRIRIRHESGVSPLDYELRVGATVVLPGPLPLSAGEVVFHDLPVGTNGVRARPTPAGAWTNSSGGTASTPRTVCTPPTTTTTTTVPATTTTTTTVPATTTTTTTVPATTTTTTPVTSDSTTPSTTAIDTSSSVPTSTAPPVTEVAGVAGGDDDPDTTTSTDAAPANDAGGSTNGDTAASAPPTTGGLPSTGSTESRQAMIAAGLIALGCAAVVVARRRPTVLDS